jgi:DMSO/TMAO reductase YedYZ molybdopterin-dependent catalytic subunit
VSNGSSGTKWPNTRIEAVEEFSKISLGKGGFWEDRGYEWYAGI